MTKQQVSTAPRVAAQDVERIRDIILGPQIREFEQRFQGIRHDLGRLQQAIDQLAERLADQGSQQSQHLQHEVEHFTRLLSEQDGRQCKSMHQEAEKQQQALDALARAVQEKDFSQSQRLAQEADRLGQLLATQGDEFGKKLQALRKEAQQADDALREELRLTAEKLTDDKTDRVSLGEMLIEIGRQLKEGGEVMALDDLLARIGDADLEPEPS